MLYNANSRLRLVDGYLQTGTEAGGSEPKNPGVQIAGKGVM